MNYQAVILAGGEGKRIAPLGIHSPKAMFGIMGKPLVQYVIENLKSVGITDLVLVASPRHEHFRQYFGNGEPYGVSIRYTIQHEPLGQADALLTAEPHIHSPFFVLNANDLFESSLLQEMMIVSQRENPGVILAGRKVSDPYRFGVMRFDASGKLTGVVEKPPQGQEPSDIAVVGVYCFSPEIFTCIHKTEAGTTDDQYERAYQMLIDQGIGAYIRYDGVFESYKFPWNLLNLSDLLLSRISGPQISPTARIAANATIDGKVIIEDNVRIFEYATVRGPAYIGKGSVVGNTALVWGGCSIGHHSVIGYGSEIKHTILGNNCWTHRNYVGDSIIADGCSFGAGTITANYRFDEQEVQVSIGESRLSTGTDKFGVIMAEGCRTGCNSVILPGLKVGPNSIIGPGVTLREDLPANKIALLTSTAYNTLDNRLDNTGRSRENLLSALEKKA
jgi:UDP-N-acetylglucosamine diphosphorylase / glucose-1-phosphate thymidylyltransferase / UDP-N-acetylgalactosamine diphosphorylase / glucosamine-1-phosphate N-acetyltransferase / galactosamine-1-phosphate N-acetyltransferase